MPLGDEAFLMRIEAHCIARSARPGEAKAVAERGETNGRFDMASP
jgi:hypothetical protein